VSDDEDQDRLVLKGCYLSFALWTLAAIILFKALAAALYGIPFFSLP
jgi:hypothetical protein